MSTETENQSHLAGVPSIAPLLLFPMTPLSQLAVGHLAVIESIQHDAPSANLLSAMGFLPGRRLEVKRFAPLGDPISVMVEGQHLSLRRSDAAAVLVKVE